MPCYCPACSDTPKPTYTEAFKRECLARYILTKDRRGRQYFYAGFAKHHGEPAARQLAVDVKDVYDGKSFYAKTTQALTGRRRRMVY